MPTPVNIARQCLAPEAEQALDEAVAVAHRRCHAQTSSLHAVSALLSLPSSPLREACGRARNSAYASRIQFKALELCLGVALDRLSSTPQRVAEPPVSNSLMAAIKRSQANQRRQPENFSLYQQTTSSCSPASASVSTVKVELQNLILSILDDPVVSRVFGESGFRSSDIKLSILRPVHRQLLRCKGPPIFLCNLTNNNSISFPFLGFLEHNEVQKQINEVLARKHGKNRRNPLLVGPSAIDTVRVFLETLRKTTSVISIRNEILSVVSGKSDVNLLELKLEEVVSVLKQSVGCGVMVEFGDLKCLVSESLLDAVGVVKKLGELVAVNGARVWLIGSAENNEICVQFFNKFPSVEDEWDLHVLHINSIRPAMPETFPKSSLMESFVPFGGFFSLPSDIRSPLSFSNNFGSLCHICDEKFKLEVNDISQGGHTGTVSDHHRSTLPSWLHASQICANREMDMVQAQDDPVAVSGKIIGLQKKWHNICQRLHQGEPCLQILPRATYTIGPRVPSVVGFQVNESAKQIAGSSIESGCDTTSKSNSRNSKDPCIVCSLSGSTASGNSGTTDLGLGQFDQKDSKLVYSLLLKRVGTQEEVLGVISQTIARCRAGLGPNRAGIWFSFVGPDRAGKKKIAIALAEVLFGGRENMICVDLSCQNFLNGCHLKLRGKNIIDFIADELIRKPLSVVFLENVDMADMLTQQHLSRAASTGRFADSHGREVSISNAILVLTSKFFGVDDLEGVDLDYTEENVLNAKSGPIRLLSWFDLDDMKPSRKRVRVTRHQQSDSPVSKNKRKHYLDLNLPADEREADYDSTPENSNSWLEDVFQHVDEKVSFKPFDFDSLAEKILKRISDCFEKNVGLDLSLEVAYKVMEQILKASCFLETAETDNWIEQVLGEAFTEAQRKYSLSVHSVLKLTTAEQPEELYSGVLLPERIIMS